MINRAGGPRPGQESGLEWAGDENQWGGLFDVILFYHFAHDMRVAGPGLN